jgi:Tol biopolymer transport system component
MVAKARATVTVDCNCGGEATNLEHKARPVSRQPSSRCHTAGDPRQRQRCNLGFDGMALGTRQPTPWLTHGPGRWQGSPHWSPDSRQIAFDSQAEDGRRHIWAIDADGGTPRQITRDEGDQFIPTWSRDGQWIYYSWAQGAVRDIWRTPAAGGAKQRITSDGVGFAGEESPDGKSLLYVPVPKDQSLLLAVPLTGGAAHQVLACVDGTAFAVGAESLYYVACGSGEAAVHGMNWATGDDRLLGTLEKYDRGGIPSSFSVSPDGSTVLYQRTVRFDMDLMLIENFR